MSHTATLLLYIAIIVTSSSFGFFSQKLSLCENGEVKEVKFFKRRFLLAALIPWFFIAFTKIGVDYINYYYIVRQESWSTFKTVLTVEPAFGLLCVLIKTIISDNPDIVIFILKTISLTLSFLSIYMIHEIISVGYAVLAFMMLAYLPSFYLISLALTMSIVFFAMSYYVKYHKYLIPLLLIVLGGLFHNAGFIFLPVFISLFIIEKAKKTSVIFKLLLTIVYAAAIFFAGNIYNLAQRSFSSFHYNNYGTNAFAGSGMMVLALYVPLVYLLYLLAKYDLKAEQKNRLFIFSLSSLLFNVLSYRFLVIERMEFLLLSLYVLFIPEILCSSGIIKLGKRKTTKSLTWIVFIIYLLFRSYLVISGRTTVESGMAYYSISSPF